MICPLCNGPATHVTVAGFEIYGCAVCPPSDSNPPLVIAKTDVARRAAATAGYPLSGADMLIEEGKARYAALKYEADRDYAGMRDFQEKFIRADKERLYLIEENEAIIQMLVDLAKKYEPDNQDLHIFLANRMKN